MTEIYGIYAILLLISSTITIYLAFYSWNKRLNPNAFYFSIVLIAVSIWSISEAFEMASLDIATKIIFSQISYIGIVLIGPFFLLFTMSYTGHKKWLKNQFIGLLMVVPIIVLFLVATNGWFGLIWPTIIPTSNQPGAILIYNHGVGFYVNTLYTYILITVGILLLLQSIIRSPKLFQKQSVIILIAAIIPIVANAIYILQSSPIPGLDITPFAFTITGILVAYSIFKYKLLDIVPIAYNKLFDKMGSGALVIDSEKRIVDINDAAKQILEINQKLIGKNVEEKLETFNELYPLDEIESESKKEILIEKPKMMWLNTQITVLESEKQLLGWLITFTDISARKIAENLLKKSEKEYRNLVDNALVGVYKTDLNGNILFTNDAMAHMMGYNSKDDFEEYKSYLMYENPGDRNYILNKLKMDGIIEKHEVNLKKKNGDVITVLLNSKLEGKVMSGMIMDITVMKDAEKQIKNSLEEKEMLLREIHHRVKNNLMVISSLLSLQSRYIKDEAYKNIFKESQNRARSMALIHELLYQSSDLKRINFGTFIKTLTNELFKIYIANQDLIELNIDVKEEVMVDINTAIPLGLIVNELVSNSMKHAFPDGRRGEIKISFKQLDYKYTLIVEDDGTGLPKGIDFKSTNSLGLRIVNSLTEQIDGELTLDNSMGSKFIIKFEEESYDEDL